MKQLKKMISTLLVALLSIGLMLPAAFAKDNSDTGPGYRKGVAIVQFEKDLSEKDKKAVKDSLDLESEKKLKKNGLEVVKFKNKTVEEVVEKLGKKKGVLFVEPDYILYPDLTPSDSLYAKYLWGLKSSENNGIDAEPAWDIETGSADVIVAVIDTGIQTTHPDLAGKFVTGYDFYNDDSSVYDGPHDYHGTHVAGTIAASMNGAGVVGVAQNVKLMPLKFLGPDGGYTSDAIEAIYYAKSNGADIINASWGGGGKSDALEIAISDFGGPFIAAAGNSGVDTDKRKHYPSSYPNPNIVSVAATSKSGSLASFSNYGDVTVDIAAPGDEILSTFPTEHNYNIIEPEDGYYWLDGTSMAAPHVSGVVALMFSENPNLSTEDLLNRLFQAAEHNSSLSGKVKYEGIVNAYKAVNAVGVSDDTVQPGATGSNIADGADGISVGMDIVLEFSEDIDIADASLISLEGSTLTSARSGNILTVSPDSDLAYGTEYLLTVKYNAVKDKSGNFMSGDYTLTFTTENSPVAVTPYFKVVSTSPVDGATGVRRETDIKVTFEKNISLHTIDASKISLSTGEAFTVELRGRESILIKPLNALPKSADVTVELDAGAIHRWDDLSEGYSFKFTTKNK